MDNDKKKGNEMLENKFTNSKMKTSSLYFYIPFNEIRSIKG